MPRPHEWKVLQSLQATAEGLSPRRGINPEHLHELGDLAKMPQRITRRLVIAAQHVDEEDVLPRMASPNTLASNSLQR